MVTLNKKLFFLVEKEGEREKIVHLFLILVTLKVHIIHYFSRCKLKKKNVFITSIKKLM